MHCTTSAFMAVVFAVSLSYGEVAESAKQLAAESETYCASTASEKPTPQLIIKKINEAAALVEKDGIKSFPKFKGKSSPFIFSGTYIWINDLEGKMLMHPIKPGMEGQALLGLKDSNGKRFFVDMITICKEKGSGWVDYMWPKPGSTDRSLKISFVKKTSCDGIPVLVGCGVYDMTMDEIKKAEAAK